MRAGEGGWKGRLGSSLCAPTAPQPWGLRLPTPSGQQPKALLHGSGRKRLARGRVRCGCWHPAFWPGGWPGRQACPCTPSSPRDVSSSKAVRASLTGVDQQAFPTQARKVGLPRGGQTDPQNTSPGREREKQTSKRAPKPPGACSAPSRKTRPVPNQSRTPRNRSSEAGQPSSQGCYTQALKHRLCKKTSNVTSKQRKRNRNEETHGYEGPDQAPGTHRRAWP